MAQIRAGQVSAIRQRAAFDFVCPADQITIVPVQSIELPRQYGVEGCGRRAVYVNIHAHPDWVPGNWVVDVGARDMPPAPETGGEHR